MIEYSNNWRTIFNELIDDDGRYEMGRVNLYQLTSHLEELYLKIAELEAKVNEN
jgi:hypothetical protein